MITRDQFSFPRILIYASRHLINLFQLGFPCRCPVLDVYTSSLTSLEVPHLLVDTTRLLTVEELELGLLYALSYRCKLASGILRVRFGPIGTSGTIFHIGVEIRDRA